jgi:uncharacterized membrane protein
MIPVASVTSESVILFIHVLAVVVAFGPTFGYGFFFGIAEASNPRAIPTVLRGVLVIDRILVTPGMLVLLAAGIWLVVDTKLAWDWSDTFVTVGLVAVIALLGMSHGFFRPRAKKAQAIAERDLGSGGEQLSDEYAALSRQLAMGGRLAGLIVAIAIFFMVVKP